MSYSTTRRTYADQFVKDQVRILSRYFGFSADQVQLADFELDTKSATDFLLPDGVKIAARVRSPQYRSRYRGQFTIRTTGQVSELDKLEWGRADYILYGY